MSNVSVLHRIADFVTGRNRVHVIYECRNCGTTVDDDDDPCPHCGPTEVRKYEIQ